MRAPDDELTVQREVSWPEEPATLETEAIATKALREEPRTVRAEARLRRSSVAAQTARVAAAAAERPGARPRQRSITALHLAGALALGALLAGGASLVAARSRATPPPAPTTQPIPNEAPVADAPARTPVASVARAFEPTAPTTAAAPDSTSTPSTAAAALAGNEYDLALRAYRALAELHPQTPVYRVIADVLARKLVHRCGEGAPCRVP